MPPRLIQFTGLPGTGKTTLARATARELRLPWLAKDHFEAILMRGDLTNGHSAHSYEFLFHTADAQLALGLGVVLDAVFPLPGFRDHVAQIAAAHGASLHIIHTTCTDETLHRQRIAERPVTVPWTPVSWVEVERLRAVYVPWPPDAVLTLDAVNPLAENTRRLHAYLNL